MSIFFFFQSGTKKTLKPVVSDEIVNEAKAKVCEFFIKLKQFRVILHHGVGGGGAQQMFKYGEALPQGCNPHPFVYSYFEKGCRKKCARATIPEGNMG